MWGLLHSAGFGEGSEVPRDRKGTQGIQISGDSRVPISYGFVEGWGTPLATSHKLSEM